MELPQLPPKPLLCINCEHYANRSLRFGEDASLMARCSAPQNFLEWNLVSGDAIYRYPTCAESRSDVPHGDSCGPFAKWFHVRIRSKQSATTTKAIEDAEEELGSSASSPTTPQSERKRSSKASLDDIV